MAKKEIFETICIFFCDRLKTKIKEFEQLKMMLLNLYAPVFNMEVLILIFFLSGRADLSRWNFPGELYWFRIASFILNGYCVCVREIHGTNNLLSVLPHSFERILSSHLKGREHFSIFVFNIISTPSTHRGKMENKFRCCSSSPRGQGQGWNLTSGVLLLKLLLRFQFSHWVAPEMHLKVCMSSQQ